MIWYSPMSRDSRSMFGKESDFFLVKSMFIKKGDYVKAVAEEGTYTGTVYNLVVQNCEDDNNRPHALIFISQDKDLIDKEGDFGCASLWVDKLLELTAINKS